jgi:hypothetical protein
MHDAGLPGGDGGLGAQLHNGGARGEQQLDEHNVHTESKPILLPDVAEALHGALHHCALARRQRQ